MAIAAFLRARALFDAHQPRKAMAEVERASQLCDEAGLSRASCGRTPPARRRWSSTRSSATSPRRCSTIDRGRAARGRRRRREARTASDRHAARRARVRVRARQRAGRRAAGVGPRVAQREEQGDVLLPAAARQSPCARRRSSARSGRTCRSRSATATSTRASTACGARSSTSASCATRTAATRSTRRASSRRTSTPSTARCWRPTSRRTKTRVRRSSKRRSPCTRAPFLSSTYSEWAEPMRRELEDRYIEALNELARAQAARGRVRGGAARCSRRWRPSTRTARRRRSASCARHIGLNDGGSAARHYRRFRQLLKDELDEEPSSGWRSSTGRHRQR